MLRWQVVVGARVSGASRAEATAASAASRRRWACANSQRVASVHVETGLIWAEILIESTGGADPIASHGHRKADARRIQALIEAAQTQHLPARADDGPVRACPFCAETIKQAARVCRFCGRELPAG